MRRPPAHHLALFSLLLWAPASADAGPRAVVAEPGPTCEAAWGDAQTVWAPLLAVLRESCPKEGEPGSPKRLICDAVLLQVEAMEEAAARQDLEGYVAAVSSLPGGMHDLGGVSFEARALTMSFDHPESAMLLAASGRVLEACEEPGSDAWSRGEHLMLYADLHEAVPDPGVWMAEVYRRLLVSTPGGQEAASSREASSEDPACLEELALLEGAQEKLDQRSFASRELALCRGLGDWSQASFRWPEGSPGPTVAGVATCGSSDWMLLFEDLSWDVNVGGSWYRLESHSASVLVSEGRLLTWLPSCSAPYSLPDPTAGARPEPVMELLHEELRRNLLVVRAAEHGWKAAFGTFLAVEEPWPRPLDRLDERLAPWTPWEGEDSPEFTRLGWRPDSPIRGSYAVELVGEDDILVHGWIDADGDGVIAHYVLSWEGEPRRLSPPEVF